MDIIADIPLREAGVRWWFRIPYYSTIMSLIYVVIYFTLPMDSSRYNALALDNDTTKQAYRWYTYSLIHGSKAHIAVNSVCTFAYGSLIEMNYLAWRTFIIHILSILGGAFAFGWELRAKQKKIMLLGASAGMYGLLGSEIAHIAFNWKDMELIQRATYLAILCSAVLSEIIIDVFYYNSNISYSGHVGGFLYGSIAGLCLISGDKSRGTFIASATTLGVLGFMSSLNLGLLTQYAVSPAA